MEVKKNMAIETITVKEVRIVKTDLFDYIRTQLAWIQPADIIKYLAEDPKDTSKFLLRVEIA